MNSGIETKRPLQCPRCERQAMSAWVKLGIGPLRTKRCRSCGEELSVAWSPYLAAGLAASLLPFAGFLLAVSLSNGSLLLALLGLASPVAPALWIHHQFVPLVARRRA